MTESEAIEKLKAHIECESKRSKIEGCNDGCADCELAYLQGTEKEHIESVKLAIQALEKQIPKKPTLICRSGAIINFYPCSTCSTPDKYIPVYPRQKYCVNCGQKLDWSDENDD